MSERAAEFIADWLAENVHEVPESEREEKAAELTEKCLADGRAAGLHADELNNASQEGLHHLILDKLGGVERPPH